MGVLAISVQLIWVLTSSNVFMYSELQTDSRSLEVFFLPLAIHRYVEMDCANSSEFSIFLRVLNETTVAVSLEAMHTGTLFLSIMANAFAVIGLHAVKDKKSTVILLYNLSVAELTYSALEIVAISAELVVTLNPELSPTASVCTYIGAFYSWAYLLGVYSTLFTLVALTLDRLLAVTQSLRYKKLMSRRHLRAIICCIWLLSSVLCATPIGAEVVGLYRNDLTTGKDEGYHEIIAQCIVLSLWFFLVCAYVFLFVTLRRRVRSLQMNCRGTISMLKGTRTACLIVGTFVVCWTPFVLITVIDSHVYGLQYDREFLLLQNGFLFLVEIGFIAEPVIYIMRVTAIRNNIRDFFFNCKKQ